MRRSCALVLNMVFEKVRYIAIQLLGGRTSMVVRAETEEAVSSNRDYAVCCCGDLKWK